MKNVSENRNRAMGTRMAPAPKPSVRKFALERVTTAEEGVMSEISMAMATTAMTTPAMSLRAPGATTGSEGG